MVLTNIFVTLEPVGLLVVIHLQRRNPLASMSMILDKFAELRYHGTNLNEDTC